MAAYETYDIDAIEQAFLGALQPLKTAGTIRTLEPYGGQLSVENLEELILLFPAVFVMWGGMQVRELGKADGAGSGASILVCDRNLRGPGAARRGDGHSPSPGVYALLKEIRELLLRKPIVPQWFHPRLVREAPLAYDPDGGLAVYEAVYELRTRT